MNRHYFKYLWTSIFDTGHSFESRWIVRVCAPELHHLLSFSLADLVQLKSHWNVPQAPLAWSIMWPLHRYSTRFKSRHSQATQAHWEAGPRDSRVCASGRRHDERWPLAPIWGRVHSGTNSLQGPLWLWLHSPASHYWPVHSCLLGRGTAIARCWYHHSSW